MEAMSENLTAEQIGRNMRMYMNRNDVSVKELASELHVAQSTAGCYMSGRGLSWLERVIPICKAIDCTPNQLFGWPER